MLVGTLSHNVYSLYVRHTCLARRECESMHTQRCEGLRASPNASCCTKLLHVVQNNKRLCCHVWGYFVKFWGIFTQGRSSLRGQPVRISSMVLLVAYPHFITRMYSPSLCRADVCRLCPRACARHGALVLLIPARAAARSGHNHHRVSAHVARPRACYLAHMGRHRIACAVRRGSVPPEPPHPTDCTFHNTFQILFLLARPFIFGLRWGFFLLANLFSHVEIFESVKRF